MISITHPAVMQYVHELPVGLLPIMFQDDPLPRLVVKVSKEIILAAKVRKGFSIHLVPYNVSGVESVGFVAAFFDDYNHPLTICGALAKELLGYQFRTLFLSEYVDVYFFDELGREVLGYKSKFVSSSAHRELMQGVGIPSAEGLNQSAIISYISEWFKFTGAKQDDCAIKVEFLEPLYPENIVFADMRDESHMYHGSSSVSHFALEREEPGSFQEQEIIALLQRIFAPEEIYHSPKRYYDREEVADILIVTGSSVFIVQAKDSPNLERVVNQSIDRKKSTALKALKKGAAQVKGAALYLKRKTPALFFNGDAEVKVDLEGKGVYGLVVMKELFNDSYDEYTPILIDVYDSKDVPTIALSYGELHTYTRFLKSEQGFLEAFNKVFNWGRRTGVFPRLRVMAPGSVINPDPVMPD
ncbi:conserved protein of unknown function [Pseudomonas sp. JV551A1]|uniref:Nuclease-related domain-containing protein n=1 Tax=Pseudomonas inefficax TaxID=2078786 RepID=A0AAQ1P604_9PSED|nr:hypothetical protein [Pseudomonas]SPO54325.1 conserved protein of unknown function [Pseudomonas sp. JV551A1]SPO59958.1 conserved protein of unknown function [Pseudomonas inefficax]